MEKNNLPGNGNRYNKKMRYVIGALMLIFLVIGILQDPAAYWESISRIPAAFATVFTWLVFTLGWGWIVIDMAAKYLMGKSLREAIQDRNPQFEQNVVVALIIAIPLLMLVAR